VEPTFASHWPRYSRALKQRNAALRASASHIDAWDGELVRSGEEITQARRRTLDRLLPRLSETFTRFGDLDVTASFASGWAAGISLADSLATHADRDR